MADQSAFADKMLDLVASQDKWSDDDEAVLEVLVAAFQLYKRRNEKYKSVWRREGWRAAVYQIKHKTARIAARFWGPGTGSQVDVTGFSESPTFLGVPLVIEEDNDIIDLINYCAFALVDMHDGNEWGS